MFPRRLSSLSNFSMWYFLLMYCFDAILIISSNQTLESEHRMHISKLILAEHNKYREKHHADPLILDDELSNEAQMRADNMTNTDVFEKSGSNFYGENIWRKQYGDKYDLMSSDEMNPVKTWYEEIKNYPGYFVSNSQLSVNSFTQIVWRSTKKLGVGISKGSEYLYVVCFYVPSGNTQEETMMDLILDYEYNVLPSDDVKWPTKQKLKLFFWYFLIVIIIIGILSAWWMYRKRHRRRPPAQATTSPRQPTPRKAG